MRYITLKIPFVSWRNSARQPLKDTKRSQVKDSMKILGIYGLLEISNCFRASEIGVAPKEVDLVFDLRKATGTTVR